ncbi:MAG: PDGLE domain-containing protein [Chitinophagales bacterium]
MSEPMNAKRSGLWLGLAAALAVAALLAPLASQKPDGLDRVAEDHGLAGRATPRAGAPFPGYRIAWIRPPGLNTALAGATGTLLTFGAGWGLSLLLRRRRPPEGPSRPDPEPWKPL